MAPRRKPVVDEADVYDNWHLRPGQGRGGKRRGWADKATRQDAPARREPPRPWEPGPRAFPPLAVVYEALPAYSLADPPDEPVL
jgi:hypothetical protein